MSSGVALRKPDDPAEATEVDPHWWLTAPNAIRLVENVRDALSAARPDLAQVFASRAATYVTRLQTADVEIRRLMAEIPPSRRGIVTNHDALGYFMAEYGLHFVGSVFPSLDVSSEPNPAQLAALADTIRSEGVTAIFSESAVNPRLAQAIADETGAHVVDTPALHRFARAAGLGRRHPRRDAAARRARDPRRAGRAPEVATPPRSLATSSASGRVPGAWRWFRRLCPPAPGSRPAASRAFSSASSASRRASACSRASASSRSWPALRFTVRRVYSRRRGAQ